MLIPRISLVPTRSVVTSMLRSLTTIFALSTVARIARAAEDVRVLLAPLITIGFAVVTKRGSEITISSPNVSSPPFANKSARSWKVVLIVPPAISPVSISPPFTFVVPSVLSISDTLPVVFSFSKVPPSIFTVPLLSIRAPVLSLERTTLPSPVNVRVLSSATVIRAVLPVFLAVIV